MRWPQTSVNQRAPSGPKATTDGRLVGSGSSYSTILPFGIRRAMTPGHHSLKKMLPSAPTAIPVGPLVVLGDPTISMDPLVVTRPIAFPTYIVNHIEPSPAP